MQVHNVLHNSPRETRRYVNAVYDTPGNGLSVCLPQVGQGQGQEGLGELIWNHQTPVVATIGVWWLCFSRVQGQSPGQRVMGAKPPEADDI